MREQTSEYEYRRAPQLWHVHELRAYRPPPARFGSGGAA